MSTRFIPFNINSYVRVRLTDLGRAIHRQQFEQLKAQMSPRATIEYIAPKEDADGWSTWQMWELMSRFGEHIGLCRPMVFLTEIEIQVVEQR